MIDNVISPEEDREESVVQSKEIDEKENRVGTCSRNKGSSRNASSENPKNTPSDLTTLPSNNTNKNDFGPLSPVHLNVGSNHVNDERALSKNSGVSSRQDQIENAVGAVRRHTASCSSNLLYDKKHVQAEIKDEGTINEYVFDEGNSLMTEVAIFAAEEEEKQLMKMINDQNTNTNSSNKTILDQSKKLVGFLEGSIRTALQQNLPADGVNTIGGRPKAADVELGPFVESSLPDTEFAEAPSEDPRLQRTSNGLNNFVGDLIGRLGSINPPPVNDDGNTQSSFGMSDSKCQSNAGLNDAIKVTSVGVEDGDEQDQDSNSEDHEPKTDGEESPISEPKSKYWETLMLRSEEPKDTRYLYSESPSPLSHKIAKETTISSPEKEPNQVNDIVDDEPAYTNNKTPLVDKKGLGKSGAPNESVEDKKNEDESSPQSMISIAEDYSPGFGALQNENSPHDKGLKSWENNSPGSLMYNMISAATNVETPLICKSRLSTDGKGNLIDSSPAVSDFGNMLSSAAELQTPELDVSFQNRTAYIVGYSPAISDFNYLITNSTTSHTRQVELTSKQAACDLLDTTPVKSNKTEVFRPTTSDSSLQSNCDESEDGSMYTSLTIQSSIQSNTPRGRRVMEWLDPNASNTVSWPVPSMTTNLRSSETPERQLPVTKANAKPKPMGKGQYLNLQKKQIRAKPKTTKKYDRRVLRPLQVGGSTSPASLPSLLGSACNEVSDLESPNIVNFPLNFKFSDEESTIQSQSVHDASEMNSISVNENLLLIASPQSLMTVATPTVGYPTDEECSYIKKPPNDVTNIHYPTTSADIFAMPTSKGSTSPHSTITNGSFERDVIDAKVFKYASCIKRCIVFGMLVAIIGATTVIAITFSTQTKQEQPSNSNEEWKNGSWRQTSSPTPNVNPPIQIDSPTLYPKVDSPSMDSSSIPLRPTHSKQSGESISVPSSKLPSESAAVVELSPAVSPTIQHTPASVPSDVSNPSTTNVDSVLASEPTTVVESSPTSSPSLRRQPTFNPELDVDPSFKPTARPTFKPNSIPTFTNEKIQEITWDRIVSGEDVWRRSEGDIDKTPLWYHAADNTSGIQLKVINAASGDRLSEQLQVAIDDYSRSKAVSSLKFTTVPYEILCAPPKMGEIKVCSGDYSDTDWIGSTILFMREEYIVSALIRINENALSLASDPLLQFALCHQVGHSLGVVDNNADLGLSSCMKDFGENVIPDGNIINTNQKLQHPNSDDLDFLVSLYGSATSRMLRGR